MKFDLGFGNSLAVREAFLHTNHNNSICFTKNDFLSFNYPNHHGDPGLVSLTADIIKRQLGLTYKYIYITNGATGGCNIAMSAYKYLDYETCLTRKAPYYLRYPKMIESTGLKHIEEKDQNSKSVILLDYPSNPLGLTTDIESEYPVILDAVYLNNVYMNPLLVDYPKHDVLVGSYSKLIGINGLRLGWIATNSDILGSKIGELVVSSYCGLGTASQDILKSMLVDFDWDLFEQYARFKLDLNREKWSRLDKYFESPVIDIGMFHYSALDNKCKELLTKAGIGWTKGSLLGTDDGFARFNLGQSNDIIDKSVKEFLKVDNIAKNSKK